MRVINLKLRRLLWQTYNFIAPILSKMGISKIRVGQRPLGHIIYPRLMKALCYRVPEPIDVNGMLMYYRTLDGRGEWGWGYVFDYEAETTSLLKKIIKPKMTVVDVGAHIGYYTLLAAKRVGIGGKVYAFEPDPSYYTLLVKNIKVNNLGRIVEPSNYAISNTGGKTILYLGKSTGSGIFKTPDATDKTSIVDLISLDMFFEKKGWPAVQIIKIDVEGAEVLALEGMKELVKRNQNLRLVIELNPPFLSTADKAPEDLLRCLSELGLHRVLLLTGNKKSYQIPQDIPYLAAVGRELTCVNLLCEQGE